MTDQHFDTQDMILETIAKQLPRRDITIDGALYLRRFYLRGGMSEKLAEYWPEDDRPPLCDDDWTIYLHCFHLPDPDRDLHNHPWHGESTILAGSYVETQILETEKGADRGDGRVAVIPLGGAITSTREPGDQYKLYPDTYHRVRELLTPRVWTLFAHGPKVQSWGFLVDGFHVPNREYFSR